MKNVNGLDIKGFHDLVELGVRDFGKQYSRATTNT